MNLENLDAQQQEDRYNVFADATPMRGPIDTAKSRTYSIKEIFGPTMQGEGEMVGKRTVFVRTQFCDGDGNNHWCKWCDTRETWDPSNVDFKKYERLKAEQILARVDELYAPDGPAVSGQWVTVSGGNPMMQLDTALVATIRSRYRLQIETQGTIWKPCAEDCDLVVVSPKPPSSGMDTLTDAQFGMWNTGAQRSKTAFKFVVFDQADFDWTVEQYNRIRRHFHNGVSSITLQAGTEQAGEAVEVLLDKYRWLVDTWLRSRLMPDVMVLPQVHVLVWGRRKGV